MNTTHYKIDLHTHSIISRDGGITVAQFEQILTRRLLDCVAITDHNEISLALKLQQQLGDKIIVGEEISTSDGEMIGLFLKARIIPGQTALQTAKAIHAQGGLVLIPHPLETFRKGLQKQTLEELHEMIDIVETFNARARFRGKAQEAEAIVSKFGLPSCANSDAHGYYGMGTAFSKVSKIPTKQTLKKLLQEANFKKSYAPFWTYLYPAVNRVRNKFSKYD
jgi:predicted metal-dependent phosphoesterase TrpH